MTDLRNPPLETERKMTETDRAIAIIEARLPLYTDIGQINALRECISSIRSALPLHLEETGWRPIETAPKDCEIIARCGPEYPAFSCFWQDTAFVHYDNEDGLIAYPVTEWMHFPAPSSTSGGGE